MTLDWPCARRATHVGATSAPPEPVDAAWRDRLRDGMPVGDRVAAPETMSAPGSRRPSVPSAGRVDVVFDRRGTPLDLSEAAVSFAAPWGVRSFWLNVGQEFAKRGANLPASLEVYAVSEDGSRETLGVITGFMLAGRRLLARLSVQGGPTTDEGTEGRPMVRQRRTTVKLKDVVQQLTDLILAMEDHAQRPVAEAVLSYVQDAVTVKIEYRRRMRELDRRLAEIEGVQAVAVSS